MPYREEIDAAMTPDGGWTKDQLAKWGVPWPPPKGWRKNLIERSCGMDFLDALDSLRPTEIKASDNRIANHTESAADQITAQITGLDRDRPHGSRSARIHRERADRELVGKAQEHGTAIIKAARDKNDDIYKIRVWLVTLEVWDAMLRNASLGDGDQLQWEGLSIVPTNLNLPLGIALATVDDVNAVILRMRQA